MLETSSAQASLFINLPSFTLGLSDDGAAVVAFLQNDAAGRRALQVLDGRPGSTGGAPVWSAPTVLDAAAPVWISDTSSMTPRLSVSPNGNALVVWTGAAPCALDSYYPLGGRDCEYLFASRRLAGASAWEAPVKLVSSTLVNGAPVPRINDAGDVAIFYSGNGSTPTGASDLYFAVALRSPAESGYRHQRLTAMGYGALAVTDSGADRPVGLDASGNLTVVTTRTNTAATQDVVAYRGTVAAGFASPLVAIELENRSATASIQAVQFGTKGHVAVALEQDSDTTRRALTLAVLSPDTGSWSRTDLTPTVGTWSSSPLWQLVVTDDVQGKVRLLRDCTVTTWTAGVLSPSVPLPTGCALVRRAAVVFDREGDYLQFNAAGSSGQWTTYDAARNTLIKKIPTTVAGTVAGDYVLGTASALPGVFPSVGALSPKGYAAAVVGTTYTTLPSASAPLGDKGAVDNLWGLYLR